MLQVNLPYRVLGVQRAEERRIKSATIGIERTPMPTEKELATKRRNPMFKFY